MTQASNVLSYNTYQLLDTGHGTKLEQVGPYRLIRPAPQALWKPSQPTALWKTAAAHYRRHSSGSGSWSYYRKLPEQWTLAYYDFSLIVKPTEFGHLGFFAEQGPQWQWLQQQIRAANRPISLLNTFAYTGGSSLAAASAGASVVHLDAADGIVAWAKENAQLAGLESAPIRWLVEDVSKFVAREIRRGNTYDALVLDPPSFGRGSKGEVWKLERDLQPLLDLCRQLLSPQPLFVLLSVHTPGCTPLTLHNLVTEMMASYDGHLSSMEMVIPEHASGRLLPSGAVARWSATCAV